MQIFEAKSDSGSVDAGLVCAERLNRAKISKQFPAIDKFKYKVKMLRILRQSFEVNNERVIDMRMDEVLVINVINLLSLDNIGLIEKFQGDILASFFILSNLNFTEATLAQDSSNLIILKLKFLDGLLLTFLHLECFN